MTCIPCQLQKLFSGMLPATRDELLDYAIDAKEPVSKEVIDLLENLERDDRYLYLSINDLVPNKKLAELWND